MEPTEQKPRPASRRGYPGAQSTAQILADEEAARQIFAALEHFTELLNCYPDLMVGFSMSNAFPYKVNFFQVTRKVKSPDLNAEPGKA